MSVAEPTRAEIERAFEDGDTMEARCRDCGRRLKIVIGGGVTECACGTCCDAYPISDGRAVGVRSDRPVVAKGSRKPKQLLEDAPNGVLLSCVRDSPRVVAECECGGEIDSDRAVAVQAITMAPLVWSYRGIPCSDCGVTYALRGRWAEPSDPPPRERPDDRGELPGGTCCLRATGPRCYGHDPANYPTYPGCFGETAKT